MRFAPWTCSSDDGSLRERPRQAYRSQLFDSLGNVSTHQLVLGEDGCVWTGTTTRCTATFSEGGTVQTARHERTEDGVRFEPSMLVTLRNIE
jgi:hypothetical protein